MRRAPHSARPLLPYTHRRARSRRGATVRLVIVFADGIVKRDHGFPPAKLIRWRADRSGCGQPNADAAFGGAAQARRGLRAGRAAWAVPEPSRSRPGAVPEPSRSRPGAVPEPSRAAWGGAARAAWGGAARA